MPAQDEHEAPDSAEQKEPTAPRNQMQPQRTRRERVGPWSRDASLPEKNEGDFVLSRMQNITGAAEGTNLPPRMQVGVRVISPTNFRLTQQQDLEGYCKLNFAWDQSPSMIPWSPSYRIRLRGDAGDQYFPSAGSPCIVQVPKRPGGGVSYTASLETRLVNGMVASEDTWPVTSVTINPPNCYFRALTSDYAAGSADRSFTADLTVAPFTLTLPDIGTLPPGGYVMYIIITAGVNNLTIAGYNASQTVDGAASIVFGGAPPMCKMLFSDGSVWRSFVPI